MLRRNRAFRALWSARVISYAGDSLSLVALMIHVAETAGQALAVSLLLLVADFAPALLAPLAGAIGDRFDRRRVMVACELGQGALVLLTALALPLLSLPLLLVLVGLRATLGQVFQAASRAAVPSLVDDRDLPAANSALGFGTNGGEVAGPLLAAALLPVLDTRGVLLVDAVSFLVSAVLLAGIGRVSVTPLDGGSIVRDAVSGLRYVWSVPAVRIVVLGFGAVVACNGIDDVALLVLATDTFGAGDSAVGILLAAIGLGLLAGYALLARYGARVPVVAMLVLGFAVSSLGNLLTGFAWAVAAAFAVQAVRGLGIAAMDVATNTLVPRLVPVGMRGRVFGNLYGVIGVAAAVSYLGGGALLDATSAPVTFVVAGIGGTLVAGVVLVTLPRAIAAAKRSPTGDR